VRSLTVTIPTGAGGDEILTGRALICIRLAPKRMTEAGTRPSQRPVPIKRMQRWSDTVSTVADGGSKPLFRNTSSCSDRAKLPGCANTHGSPTRSASIKFRRLAQRLSEPAATAFGSLNNGSAITQHEFNIPITQIVVLSGRDVFGQHVKRHPRNFLRKPFSQNGEQTTGHRLHSRVPLGGSRWLWKRPQCDAHFLQLAKITMRGRIRHSAWHFPCHR
jgi:hypothetical protein